MPNMGTEAKLQTSGGLAAALFSGTRQRLLGLLFGQPSRSFYANELIELAGIGSGAVQRELANLTQSGLVNVRPVGNQKHFQANAASPIFVELCGIVQKTIGLVDPLREALAPVAEQVIAAFVYGSVAKKTDTAASDIDLLVLSGTLTYGDVFAELDAVHAVLGRAVNPTILSPEDFRLKANDSFLRRVLQQPKVWVIGGEDDLTV